MNKQAFLEGFQEAFKQAGDIPPSLPAVAISPQEMEEDLSRRGIDLRDPEFLETLKSFFPKYNTPVSAPADMQLPNTGNFNLVRLFKNLANE